MLPLNDAVHLCVDMQRILQTAGIWETPWMERVLPGRGGDCRAISRAHHPHPLHHAAVIRLVAVTFCTAGFHTNCELIQAVAGRATLSTG